MLADFPTTFGLTVLCKGFFPHLFNTVENQDYKGPLRKKSFCDPDGMSPKKKKEFELWYVGKVANNYQFDLRQDMLAYCESDVKLFKAGCRKFSEQFEEHAEIDPLEKSITIASTCIRFWQKKLLTPNTVSSEPLRMVRRSLQPICQSHEMVGLARASPSKWHHSLFVDRRASC